LELKPDLPKFELNQNPIINAISNNQIKTVFAMLFERAKENTELENELILQKAAWGDVLNRIGDGTITETDATIQKARIRKNLIHIIEKFGLQ
jgi:hypothetical protein